MSYGTFNYITPEEAVKLNVCAGYTLAAYKRLAATTGDCPCCCAPIWRIADTGLCFSCTTGEADRSNDYELI